MQGKIPIVCYCTIILVMTKSLMYFVECFISLLINYYYSIIRYNYNMLYILYFYRYLWRSFLIRSIADFSTFVIESTTGSETQFIFEKAKACVIDIVAGFALGSSSFVCPGLSFIITRRSLRFSFYVMLKHLSIVSS